ncbi:MAG: cytochrome c3 family protein [bacterium]|nr:cytochrome c3 family protein [bacterium]
MDCRYCHFTVEKATHASIPPTEVCMNCHTTIKTDSPHIKKLTESYETGKPIEWVKVHQLPDYAYFDHSRHVNSGIGCASCHGRVDKMEEVRQVEPLSMSWCLECHRNVEDFVRPKDKIAEMDYHSENQQVEGEFLKSLYKLAPREDCTTCHR